MSNPLISEERAKKLLGSGLNGAEVASVVGCDPSYISQLMADDDFRASVMELRVQNLTAATERDSVIDSLEDRALKKLDDMLEWVSKPREMESLFRTLNAAKRRGTAPKDNVVINNQIVNLTLPAAAFQQLTMNAHGEVIQIGENPMITMQPATLLKQLVDQKGASDATTNALKAVRTRELATHGYEKRTDASGNRSALSSERRSYTDSFDI